jgi:hypothetical protein
MYPTANLPLPHGFGTGLVEVGMVVAETPTIPNAVFSQFRDVLACKK